MSKVTPDHHDADLLLKVYDLRRETVMRESRSAIAAQFWPKTYDDVLAVVQGGHPLNAAWRQTTSYWEMVYNMARQGIVHAEYFVEGNGEGLLLFAKIEPYLKQFRDQFSPTAFRNTEWAATETQIGREIMGRFRSRLVMMRKMMEEAMAAKGKTGAAKPAAKTAGKATGKAAGKRKR